MTTNNDHAAALELWSVMGEVEGLRPKHLYEGTVDCDHHFYYDCDMGYSESGIDDTDALHILTGHAQDWLRERGWLPLGGGSTGYGIIEINPDSVLAWSLLRNSLPEAIRAEAGRG